MQNISCSHWVHGAGQAVVTENFINETCGMEEFKDNGSQEAVCAFDMYVCMYVHVIK